MDNGINVRKSIYEAAREFRKKYPLTVAFRLKANSAVVQKHLDAGETPLYTFVGQSVKTVWDVTRLLSLQLQINVF